MDWIERVLHVSPDGGNGAVEFVIYLVLITVAAATGAYMNDDPRYLQSAGFVLAPDGTVRVAVYSSDAIGRLVADDVAGYIRYLTEHAA